MMSFIRIKIAKKCIFVIISLMICIYLLSSSETNVKYHVKKMIGTLEEIDWQDHDFIRSEMLRKGPGERSAVKLTDQAEIDKNEEEIELEGLSITISDKVSVSRALPDPRSEKCKNKKYLKALPRTSVIVIFYNEILSVLLRCLHSIYNRTPNELLHEIILINDNSTRVELYGRLEKYLRKHFNGTVKLIHNPTRQGLISTRMNGARMASGDVIVFLDSHMEVNTNWLPPLLEPIALNRRTATVPQLDDIHPENLEYENLMNYLKGGFDWNMRFQYFGMSDMEYPVKDEPFNSAAMTGGAYAIDRRYFFELGGYDEGMYLYNAENYELSFKLQLCGGYLLNVPCSRVGHMDRLFKEYEYSVNGTDYSVRNLRRLVEVWFDEYKYLYYRNHPKRKVECGDLTKAIALRKKLNCKPFKFYMENVAPYILERYPIKKMPHFAYGAIQSMANKKMCITAPKDLGIAKLKICSKNLKFPSSRQNFALTWHRMIRLRNVKKGESCLSLNEIEDCHYQQEHQLLQYIPKTLQITVASGGNCLWANFKKNRLGIAACNQSDINQKWNFGYKNLTALTNWKTYGAKFL